MVVSNNFHLVISQFSCTSQQIIIVIISFHAVKCESALNFVFLYWTLKQSEFYYKRDYSDILSMGGPCLVMIPKYFTKH